MDKIIGIYKIENKVNGHVYIGQSINIKRRWFEHRCDLRGNRHYNGHLQSSWNKYGEKNFIHEVVETCDISELDDREKYWIGFYDSTNAQKGYNLSPGGEHYYDVSNETREKLSLLGKGRKFSKERNESISRQLKGRKFTDEHKLSLSLTKQMHSALKHPDTWYKNKTKLPTNKSVTRLIGENNPSSKYTEETIKNVIKLFLDDKSNIEISRETGVNQGVISDIRQKKLWTHLTNGLNFPSGPNRYSKEINDKIMEDIKNNLTRKEIIAKYNISDKKLNKMKCSLKEVS